MRKTFCTIQKFWLGIELNSNLLSGTPIANQRKWGKKIILILFVCFSISSNAQNFDTVATNPGSNVNDFKQQSFFTKTEKMLSKTINLSDINGALLVDVFFNDSCKIIGFNIRSLKINDLIQSKTIVDFRNSSSINILKKSQYPKLVQQYYDNIELFLLETLFKRAENEKIDNLNIVTFRFSIMD